MSMLSLGQNFANLNHIHCCNESTLFVVSRQGLWIYVKHVPSWSHDNVMETLSFSAGRKKWLRTPKWLHGMPRTWFVCEYVELLGPAMPTGCVQDESEKEADEQHFDIAFLFHSTPLLLIWRHPMFGVAATFDYWMGQVRKYIITDHYSSDWVELMFNVIFGFGWNSGFHSLLPNRGGERGQDVVGLAC